MVVHSADVMNSCPPVQSGDTGEMSMVTEAMDLFNWVTWTSKESSPTGR